MNRPVVFIHGSSDSARIWLSQIEHLEQLRPWPLTYQIMDREPTSFQPKPVNQAIEQWMQQQ